VSTELINSRIVISEVILNRGFGEIGARAALSSRISSKRIYEDWSARMQEQEEYSGRDFW
jgi:hypothetical protein